MRKKLSESRRLYCGRCNDVLPVSYRRLEFKNGPVKNEDQWLCRCGWVCLTVADWRNH